MGRLKKLKKIRIHREGTHILWGSFFLLLIINAALYWGIDCKIPFYLMALVSVVVYLLMVNFFRCPIRLFGQDTERIVVAPADGKIVVIEEVDEHDIHFHEHSKRTCQLVPGGWSRQKSLSRKRQVHESMASESQHRERAFNGCY